jgi:hypothetical protein
MFCLRLTIAPTLKPWVCWQANYWFRGRRHSANPALLRLATVSLAIYLLFATIVHPWYATLIVPMLPFLPAKGGEVARASRFLLPWLTFSAAVPPGRARAGSHQQKLDTQSKLPYNNN